MLAILLLLSVLRPSPSVPTTAILASTRDDDAHLALFGREVPPFLDTARYRTRQEIVWSCLATIFACSWVAVHPNLPGPYDSRWSIFKRRVMMMIYAIIAPELMVMWALAQWKAARDIVEVFNEKNSKDKTEQHTHGQDRLLWRLVKALNDWLFGPTWRPSKRWTLTHGFFVQMGGFTLCEGDTPIRVLTFDDLQKMIEEGLVDAPTIREDEIEDKSKGDFFTKLVVVFQTTWFVFQCLARWASHLPVTELEVVTLASATLNFVIYALWWKKPQSVSIAVAVPLKPRSSNGAGLSTMHNGDAGAWIEGVCVEDVERGQKKETQKVDPFIVAFFWLIAGLFYPLMKTGIGFNKFRHQSLRIPTFYAESGFEPFFAMIIGPLFGALHLIPWSSTFPSTTECWLWRSSALVITIEPLMPFLLSLLGMIGELCPEWLTIVLSVPFLVLVVSACLGLPLYIFARLILLVVAFSTLRDLPKDAYITPEWTISIPHI